MKILCLEAVECDNRWGDTYNYIVIEFNDKELYYTLKFEIEHEEFSLNDFKPPSFDKMPILLKTTQKENILNMIETKIPFLSTLTVRLNNFPFDNDRNWFYSSGVKLHEDLRYSQYNKCCSNAIVEGLDSLTKVL